MVMSAVGRPLYLDHFVLREPPFKLTPHTPFFYPGGNRGAILRALLYAAMNTEGVVTVTGEVGTGKTMLARMLIDHRPSSLEIAYIANPAMTRDDIVLTIAQELRIRPTGRTPRELLKALQMKLIELHLEGKRVSVLIDEAHVMSPDALEEIRLLSNLETRQHKLLRIILVGQDELRQTLATARMRPLRERITERFQLGPLGAADVADYLSYRLRLAGGDPQTFEPRAVALIARDSEGLGRRINILADKALLAAFAERERFVADRHARMAIADARFVPLYGWRAWVASAAASFTAATRWRRPAASSAA